MYWAIIPVRKTSRSCIIFHNYSSITARDLIGFIIGDCKRISCHWVLWKIWEKSFIFRVLFINQKPQYQISFRLIFILFYNLEKIYKIKKKLNSFWEQIIQNGILGFLIALYFGHNKWQPTACKANTGPNWNKKIIVR